MINEYESLTSDLLRWIEDTIEVLNQREFENSLQGVQAQLSQFNAYRTQEKPPKLVTLLFSDSRASIYAKSAESHGRYSIRHLWSCLLNNLGYFVNQRAFSIFLCFIIVICSCYLRFVEKGNLEILLFTLQSQMRANNQKPYLPKEGKLISDINKAWENLERAEHERELALREELIRYYSSVLSSSQLTFSVTSIFQLPHKLQAGKTRAIGSKVWQKGWPERGVAEWKSETCFASQY